MKANPGRAISLQGEFTFQNALGGPLRTLEACPELPFNPSISVQQQQPEEGQPQEHTSTASTPTGLNADVKVAQQGTLHRRPAGDADLKNTTVDTARRRAAQPLRRERSAGLL